MKGVLPKLTREYILDHVSELQILSEFLGVAASEIEYCLERGHLIKSPLRPDASPTCGFYIGSGNRIRFNDFAGHFQGDCFDVVGYIYHLNPSVKQEFGKIKDIIAKYFGLHYYTKFSKVQIKKFKKELKKRPPTKIDVRVRAWVKDDVRYFTSQGISIKALNHYEVKPVTLAWVNGRLIYQYTSKDPCYVYYHGVLKGYSQFKLHFPAREKNRFITNTQRLFGLNKIKKAKAGVLIKSAKDTVAAFNLGFEAVGLPNETRVISSDEFNVVSSYWDDIYCMTDFDYTGIRLAIKLRKFFGIKPLFLTNGRYNTLNFEAKDITDYNQKFGIGQTRKLVQYLKEMGTQMDNDFFEFFQQDLEHEIIIK